MAAHPVSSWPPYPALLPDPQFPGITTIQNLPQFYPGGSIRMVDATVFAQIIADYPNQYVAGTLWGVSPQTLIDNYGVTWNIDPSANDYNVTNGIGHVFTQSDEIYTGFGAPVGNVDGIQTATGGTYTDPNGQTFTSITWCWGMELALYTLGSGENRWDQEIVTWTGDGTSARLIPTSFALNDGKVAVWVYPQITDAPVFRNSDMSGTIGAATPIVTTGGIMAFQSGGFTVTDDVPSATLVNKIGRFYTALVFKCSDSVSPFMSFGTYPGVGAIVTTGTFVTGSRTCTIVGLTSADIGRFITINASQADLIVGVSGTTITLQDPSLFNGVQGVTCPAGGQTIQLTNQELAPTQIWVHGRSGTAAFWTEDMPAAQSTSFGNEAKNLTDQITSVATGSFQPGSDNNVNSTLLTYYYVAFHIPADHDIRSQFRTFKITGNGGSVATTGFGFQPGFAIARRFTAGNVAGSAWKASGQLTTHSTQFSGADLASGGVEALGADGITVGTTVAPNAVDCYGFAVKGGANDASSFDTPTYSHTDTFTNPDGTTSTIQTFQQSQTPPDSDWTLVSPDDVLQWWCNDDFGYSVYQIDNPGTGWEACAGPATDNGWILSVNDFGGQATIVSGGTPANPRTWAQIATWATVATGMLGGSPGAAAATGKNSFVYPGSDYTVGTHYPPIRIFNGRSDRELCRLPATSAGVIPKAVISMLAANGTIYLTTWDAGTTSADWSGRVFSLDAETGVLTLLGTAFAAGEMPYALAWHMGRLWCGTNNGIGTVGKVYFFRPEIDTAWTQDYATSSSTAGGVDSMVSYKGKLYVGTDNAAASRGKVLVRDTAGAYTTSLTGTDGTARVNNGYLQMAVFGTNLYAAYWNNDAPSIAKIEKFDGATWSTAYTGSGDTVRPFIQLLVDNGYLYAFGGGSLLSAAILSTSNGTLWTDLTDELPESDTTLLPMFGVVVL